MRIAPSPSTTKRPRRAGRDEVDELAEERLLAVLGVVLLAELAARGEELALADLEAARLDPAEDLGGEPAAHRVGLDEDECLLDGHRGGQSSRAPALLGCASWLRRGWSAGGAPTGGASCIGVSQYGQTCQIGSSGALQLVHACLSFVVQTGQTRKLGSTSGVADGAADVGRGEPRLDRADLELALAPVVDELRRAEQHVDERPDERREQPDERREPDEERLLDAPGRVAERPVAQREPEHDEDRAGDLDAELRVTRAEGACENVTRAS